MEMTQLDVSVPSQSEHESSAVEEEEVDETSPVRGGPPSEASSQEWDQVTDPGVQTPAST